MALLFVASLRLALPRRHSGMRVGTIPPGSFSDDSDGDARASPRVASTSHREASAEVEDLDLRDMLEAAEAARAALREVASSAAAEREMALEARDVATAECDRLRGELEPLRASLARATRVAAQRDDETKSLRFKLEQLLRHARERDFETRRLSITDANDSDAVSEASEEERLYVEAMATLTASVELELAETRAALRDARDEAAEAFSADAAARRERDGLRRDVERLTALLERERASRSEARRARDGDSSDVSETRADAEAEASRREEDARRCGETEAEARDAPPATPSLVATTTAGPAFAPERGGATDGEPSSRTTNDRSEGDSARAFPTTALDALGALDALDALDEHRRSTRAHLEALRRDRETLARAKTNVASRAADA